MDGDEVCTCGHVADEHEDGAHGPAKCDVDDCDCPHFEEDEEATEKARDEGMIPEEL